MPSPPAASHDAGGMAKQSIEIRTLGDQRADKWHDLQAYCKNTECGHSVPLDLEELIARKGEAFLLDDLPRILTCGPCKAARRNYNNCDWHRACRHARGMRHRGVHS